VHTYELTPNSAGAAAGKVWRRRQPNFGRRGSARRRASRIWSAPAGKRTAARLRGLWPSSLRSSILYYICNARADLDFLNYIGPP